MRTAVYLYSALRWPVLAGLIFASFLCPASAGLVNVGYGLCIGLYILFNHDCTPARQSLITGALAIGGAVVLCIMAIVAYHVAQQGLGWFIIERYHSATANTYFFLWVLAVTVVFIIGCLIPAFEELRRDVERYHGDIDL